MEHILYPTAIGIDVSDRKSQVCVMCEEENDKRIALETRIPMTKEGLAKILETQDRSAAVTADGDVGPAHGNGRFQFKGGSLIHQIALKLWYTMNMNKLRFSLTVLAATATLVATARAPNYDESKIKPFTNADPLVFADGRPVASRSDWLARRREIVNIFSREMYGRPLPEPETVFVETVEKGTTLDGFAVREQLKMRFRNDGSGPSINWLIVRPAHTAGTVPVIILLNYRGNHELLTDREIRLPDCWLENDGGATPRVVGNRAQESTRGYYRRTNCATQFPIEMIIARGYAVMTACYGEISPDPPSDLQDSLAWTGVFDLFPGIRDPARNDNPTALGAWAWAISRAVDHIVRDNALDEKRIIATGYSRLAKAALLAASRDERIAVVVPNQTGGGGVPLARRDFGENVSTEMRSFKHWYCAAYGKYIDNEESMPFDQHFLVASIAPRRILVEGFNNPWFDTKGEWLSCRAASRVWEFLGLPGLPDKPFPDDCSLVCVGSHLGYYRRPCGHGINGFDWMVLLDFADRAFATP